MKKYLVISWDEDQNQCFWDCVVAADEATASKKVRKVRESYAVLVDVIELEKVGLMANVYGKMAMKEINRYWRKFVKENK